MSVYINSQSAIAIRKLTPFNTLSTGHFDALCAEITIEKQNPGYELFKRGDTVKDYVYLLEGEVSLQSPEFSIETVSAQDEPVRFPLAHQIPRKIDAVALTPIRFFRINPESIHVSPEVYYQYKEETGYVVANESDADADDWMAALLSTPIFQRLPASNLQKILMQLETVQYTAGETIVKQDEEGAYFYFIRNGECQIMRRHTPDGKNIVLAQLGRYESFGEDALISGMPQQASVIAMSGLTVARMDKEKFNVLIKEPAIQYIEFETAQPYLQENTAVLLDVRDQDAYNALHIGGSQNVPFFSLPMQLKMLNREWKIILVCQDGKLSAAAAYLLLKSGFEAAVVKGGINALSQDVLIGSQAVVNDNPLAVAASAELIQAYTAETQAYHQAFTSFDSPTGSLEAENAALKAALEKLQAKYEGMLVEKQRLEKNFRALMVQTEQLKALLRKVKSKDSPNQ